MEGDEHMVWNIDSCKINEKTQNGLMGILRKVKMNSTTMSGKKGDYDEKLPETYLSSGKKTDTGFFN